MAQRIKGQEVSVLIISGGTLQAKITEITNSEITFELEILEEGYIGRKSNDFDMIFNGMTVKMECHMSNDQAISFTQAITDRAARRTGEGARIDVVHVFEFDNGQFVSITVPNLQFQSVPISNGGRGEYVSISFEAKSSEFQIA
jgi:hypothetical protein